MALGFSIPLMSQLDTSTTWEELRRLVPQNRSTCLAYCLKLYGQIDNLPKEEDHVLVRFFTFAKENASSELSIDELFKQFECFIFNINITDVYAEDNKEVSHDCFYYYEDTIPEMDVPAKLVSFGIPNALIPFLWVYGGNSVIVKPSFANTLSVVYFMHYKCVSQKISLSIKHTCHAEDVIRGILFKLFVKESDTFTATDFAFYVELSIG